MSGKNQSRGTSIVIAEKAELIDSLGEFWFKTSWRWARIERADVLGGRFEQMALTQEDEVLKTAAGASQKVVHEAHTTPSVANTARQQRSDP